MANRPGYNSRKNEYEKVKSKKNRYPYNLLLDTFSNICGEAQAKNLNILMKSLSKRNEDAAITLASYGGWSNEDIMEKFKCKERHIQTAINNTKKDIIKYKDSLFNGFNNSKYCLKLRREFKGAGIPEDIILDLNECKIYDIYELERMSSKEFITALTNKFDIKKSANILQYVVTSLKFMGYNVSNLLSGFESDTGEDNAVEEKTKCTIEENQEFAKIIKVELAATIYYECPFCNEESLIKLPIKCTKTNVYVDNLFDNNKEYRCPKCGNKIIFLKK